MDLDNLLAEAERQQERFLWEGTFSQYLRMATDQPNIVRLSHSRIFDMIISNGVETGSYGEQVYGLFKDHIFGMERKLEKVVEYFASAAKGFEVRNRILLLLGPPASGKSSIVNLIKKGLERYTRGEEGAVYAIKGCPMQEEPLHLIPDELRPSLKDEFGLNIEGELCPRCAYALRHQYKGHIADVEVIRVSLSESESVGIGSFVSSDPGSQNLGLLVGSIDSNEMSGTRLEVAGRAYRLDGELNVANRGIMEFAELFKTEETLLRVLLGLAQERVIKMGRFGSVYADEAVVAHSNQGDFKDFSANPKAEALLDRIITINIPYNLRVSEEERIYALMLQSAGFRESGVHISPLTLQVMATFAVLSRFEPPSKQGMSLSDKLRLYDGQHVPPYTHNDLLEMGENNPDEGMSGVSPRYVLNKLSNVVTQKSEGCISPLMGLNTLWEGLSEHVNLAAVDRARYALLLQETLVQYDYLSQNEVCRGHVNEFEKESDRLFDIYRASVFAYLQGGVMLDPQTGVEMPSDEKTMRYLEEAVGITQRNKDKFRNEVSERLRVAELLGQEPTYTTVPEIRNAIEKLLYPNPRALEKTLFATTKSGVQDERDKIAMIQRLVGIYGYCDECAQDLIDYVKFRLKGGQAIRTTRASRVRWVWKFS
jgi:serine protein kinase